MRLRLCIALLCSAPATLAADKLGLEAEYGMGPIWAVTGLCSNSGCPSPLGISVRAGYELLPYASLGLRGAAVLGPEGSGRVCGTSNCENVAGYRAASLLLDARLHTVGVVQLSGGLAVGVGRLIRLQCNCSEQYDTHGSGLPVLQVALGLRAYVVPQTVHVGIEGRYQAMFNAESGGATSLGPPVPQTGLTVSSVGLSFVVGASL